MGTTIANGRTLWRASLAAGLALLVAAALPRAAAADTPAACNPLPSSKIQSVLGFPHLLEVRETSSLEETGSLEPDELPEAVDNECDRLAWTGAAPKFRAAVYRKARRGEGAQIGIETWRPNFESPNGEHWVTRGFQELTDEFVKARFHLVHGFPGVARSSDPADDGYQAAGMTIKGSGVARGMLAALGCWWNVENHRAICIADEEAKSKPVLADLNAFGKAAVPGFLGGT